MKKIYYILFLSVFFLAFMACIDDEGNYDYLPEEEVSTIKIDTSGMTPEEKLALSYNMNPGDTIIFEPDVIYKYPERLRYRWFYIDIPYQAITEGGSQVYPAADTIGWAKRLEWVCDLEPGNYRFYLMAEDTVSGAKGYFQATGNYVSVNQAGILDGIYLLTETEDGNTDIEVYSSALQLVTGGTGSHFRYYRETTGRILPGKPRFIRGGSDGTSGWSVKSAYVVATDQGMWRLNEVGMQTMDEWNDMFYDVPTTFNPQLSLFANAGSNQGEFLINDGKLHVLYTDEANDRKYSAPIAGDYEAGNYLMWMSYGKTSGLDQVIYDKKNHCFRPYYPKASSISSFGATAADAYLDANHLPADPVAILTADKGYITYAILWVDGTPWLYRFNFYQSVDKGDLSYGGTRAKLDLSGCTDIANARYYTSVAYEYDNTPAFYYATDKGVYSFSPESGQTTSQTIYECTATETVTAIYAPGSVGGGWPTSAVCFYVALWDSATQEGKLLEYEMNHANGVPHSMYGPMFGAGDENPVVTTGYGKIVSMSWIDAE